MERKLIPTTRTTLQWCLHFLKVMLRPVKMLHLHFESMLTTAKIVGKGRFFKAHAPICVTQT
jgi:hypothetical protein